MGCRQVITKRPNQNKLDVKEEINSENSTPKNEIKSSIFSQGQGIINTQNVLAEYSKINCIARPIYDPFEIVILDLGNKKVSVDSSFTNDARVKDFCILSAFCNGRDKLFISGGESVKANSFCIIDLIEKKIDFKLMKTSRRNHSMIFIPNNSIFIVGGPSTKSVEVYNMSNKKDSSGITEHSTMNEVRIEPALCLIDNSFLYAFTGFKKDAKKTFERINLRSNGTMWELINVNLEKGLSFGQNFFAVAFYKQNEVIFLGGSDTEKNTQKCEKSHVFNFEKNLISLAQLEITNEDYSEKFFIPVDAVVKGGRKNPENNQEINSENFTSILFPNFHRNNIKISIFSNLKLNEVKFEIDN